MCVFVCVCACVFARVCQGLSGAYDLGALHTESAHKRERESEREWERERERARESESQGESEGEGEGEGHVSRSLLH